MENIHFAYDKHSKVLANLDLQVEQGSIYGFLGPNGAGKTTTLRVILGLMKAQSGIVKIFGEDIHHSYPKHLTQVGSLVENPSLYTHLSGWNNLAVWSKYYNLKKNRIEEVLELVGLKEAGKKKVGSYSTGMKQRLGLGIALLNDPNLLILDEPTNGLDPLGIIALREILFKLQDAGKTILLSSHILTEVEKIVTDIGIIQGGKLVYQGSKAALLELRKQNVEVQLRVSDMKKASEILPEILEFQEQENGLVFQLSHENEIPGLVKTLVSAGIDVYELKHLTGDLEKRFLSLTKDQD